MIFYGYVSHNQMASSPSSPQVVGWLRPTSRCWWWVQKKTLQKSSSQCRSFLFKTISIKKEIGMMIIFRQTLGWYYLLSICNMFKHSNSWSDDPQWFCELRLRLERPATEGIGLPLGRCQASDQKSPKNKQKMVRERWEHHSSDPMFGGSAWI